LKIEGLKFRAGKNNELVIARTLYHNPKILIMDEAKSSLDTINEKRNKMPTTRKLREN
jgi:ABC-type multidrug transport system fused ATPase/permease subunit